MSLPKPYYEDSAVTIYNADCREILPLLPKVDLVLTDPPYPGITGGMNRSLPSSIGAKIKQINKTLGEKWGADISPLSDAFGLAEKGAIIFAAYSSLVAVASAIPHKPASLITWHKRNAMPAMANVPQMKSEFAWVFRKSNDADWRRIESVYEIPNLQAGTHASERFTDISNRAVHPCQKPLVLFRSLLIRGMDSILDPYCGTGTTLEAAKLEGRKAIGIEISEAYCELAARRCRQDVLALEFDS